MWLRTFIVVGFVLIASLARAGFVIFGTFIPSSAAVVCTFTTGACTGTGGGSGLFTAGTCNGVADDTASFDAFTTWAVGTWQAAPHTGQIELFIPSGSNCVLNTSATTFLNIKNLLVSGYGASLNGTYYHLAGEGLYQDNLHSTRLSAVALGATSVTVDPSAASQPAACSTLAGCVNLFTVGDWAFLSGYSLQPTGFPSNPFYFEYVLITGKNTSTGVITFASPTANAYKATWPNYNVGSGSEVDQGGPATLYALKPGWNMVVEWKGITFNRDLPSGNLEIDAVSRQATFTDTVWTPSGSNTCLFASQNGSLNVVNSTMTNCQMEFDKIVYAFSMSGSTINTLYFQTGAATNVTITGGSTIFNIIGTPYAMTIAGSTITGGIAPGPVYGYTKSISIATTALAAFTAGGNPGGYLYSGQSDEGLNNSSMSMSGGIITIPKTYLASGSNPQPGYGWFAPGANICWADTTYTCATIWQVQDVTDDATNVYVHTSSSGGFPSWTFTGNGLEARVHPAVQFTCDVTTCGSFYTGAPPAIPLWSYQRITWNNSFAGGFGFFQWGNISTITANVTAAYGGATSPAIDNVRPNDSINPTTYAPNAYSLATVDLRTSGNRTIDTSGGFPAAWSGSVGTDNLPNITSTTWITNLFDNLLTNLSGDPGNPFSITVTVTTDQGVVVP